MSTPGAAPRTVGTRGQRRRALNGLREPLPTRVRDTPVLPDAYRDALDAGLDALALPLDERAREVIDGHVRLLLAWTPHINLTAIRDPVEVATAHVIDSLAAVVPLRERRVVRFVDLGSGGGFPGIPLAASLPAERALLVESVAKKARFLSVVADAVGRDAVVDVHAGRVETLAADPGHRGAWPAVVARAVASLAELVELAFPLLTRGGTLVAWKRGPLDVELRAAERAIGAIGGGSIEVVSVAAPGLADHRLVLASPSGEVPDSFPRDPAVRRRRPW